MALEGFTGLESAAGLVIEPDVCLVFSLIWNSIDCVQTFDEDDNDSACGKDELR